MAGLPYLVLVCVVLVETQVAAELTCSLSNSSEMRVTFDSHRNKTGRWTHAISLEQKGLPRYSSTNDQNTVPWTVDVKYVPKTCDDKLKDSLKVLISFSESRYATDYVFIPGLGYYKYYSTLVTWPVAKATCEQDGAYLAILNSQQEADALKKLMANGSDEWAWLGLVKNDTKGEFITIFGDPVGTTGFNQWYSGVNPANAIGNSAAGLSKSAGTMSYDSAPSTTNHYFLCEQYE